MKEGDRNLKLSDTVLGFGSQDLWLIHPPSEVKTSPKCLQPHLELYCSVAIQKGMFGKNDNTVWIAFYISLIDEMNWINYFGIFTTMIRTYLLHELASLIISINIGSSFSFVGFKHIPTNSYSSTLWGIFTPSRKPSLFYIWDITFHH